MVNQWDASVAWLSVDLRWSVQAQGPRLFWLRLLLPHIVFVVWVVGCLENWKCPDWRVSVGRSLKGTVLLSGAVCLPHRPSRCHHLGWNRKLVHRFGERWADVQHGRTAETRQRHLDVVHPFIYPLFFWSQAAQTAAAPRRDWQLHVKFSPLLKMTWKSFLSQL